MNNDNTVVFTIAVTDADLDDDELDQATRTLQRTLNDDDDVDRVERPRATDLPDGAKSVGGELLNVLDISVPFGKAKDFLIGLWEKLGRKPVKLKVRNKDRALELEANSAEEMEQVIAAARAFLTK